MTKKSLLWISLSPLAVLPPTLIVACGNNNSANDKPGDNPGSQPITGQQTIAKTNLTAQSLGLNGTLSDAKSLINEQWILTNKDNLLDGGTNLFTSTNDLVTDSVLFDPDSTDTEITTGTLNFSLKAGKSFGSDSKPTSEATKFIIKITNFKTPPLKDLEKAKNKYLQYLDEIKYEFHKKKASEFQINDLKQFGTSDNFGFKTEIELDTDNGSSRDDNAGTIAVQITLTRGANEKNKFKHTISGFKTGVQDRAENDDSNLNPKSMFNETFVGQNPSEAITVKTKNPGADWKNVKTKDELLKLISIAPNTNLKQNQQDKSAILKQALPSDYDLEFVENSIRPRTVWNKTFDEIEASVQLVKKDGSAKSGIYQLIVDGFTKKQTKEVLDEWADFFEVGKSPIKTTENQYLNVQATSINDAATLEPHLNLATDNRYQNPLLDRGITFELDKAVAPTNQNDETGSLKAQFIFKWKDGANAALEVKKVITLYGFQLNS